MKQFVLSFLLIPFFVGAKAQFTITNTSTISIAEIRPDSDPWPLELQRMVKSKDTVYVLTFRDKQSTNSVNMSTLKFGNLRQLRYFEEGLVALKNGSDGDQVNFDVGHYNIKRTDVKEMKKMKIKYVLTCDAGDLTDIQQVEADKLITAIKSL